MIRRLLMWLRRRHSPTVAVTIRADASAWDREVADVVESLERLERAARNRRG